MSLEIPRAKKMKIAVDLQGALLRKNCKDCIVGMKWLFAEFACVDVLALIGLDSGKDDYVFSGRRTA
jgi:hypothetical protein